MAFDMWRKFNAPEAVGLSNSNSMYGYILIIVIKSTHNILNSRYLEHSCHLYAGNKIPPGSDTSTCGERLSESAPPEN